MKKKLVTGLLVVASLGATACGSSAQRAATATAGDAFCVLAAKAVAIGNAVDTSGGPANLKGGVAAAVAADKAAEAVAPKDFTDLGQQSIAQEEKLVAILEKYKYDFTATLASPEGKALLGGASDYNAMKAKRDGYLKDKCGIAPTADTSNSTSIKLAAGVEGLQQFLSILQLNPEVAISDEQVSCLVGALTDKISDADLQAIIDKGEVTDAGQTALEQAFVDCGVNV